MARDGRVAEDEVSEAQWLAELADDDRSSNRSDALRLIQVLLPLLIGILGLAGVAGFADIRPRYQWVTDLVLGISVVAIVVALVAALYPIALAGPTKASIRLLQSIKAKRSERRNFNEWIGLWAEYSDLVMSVTDGERPDVKRCLELQPEYERLREALLEKTRLLPSDSTLHVLDHLGAQWRKPTQLEYLLRGEDRGFFALYSQVEFDLQAINMAIETKGRHLAHTVIGVWDGLSSYSNERGWGRLEPRGWRRVEESS